MPNPDDFNQLKASGLIARVISESRQESATDIRQKIRVELTNGWLMECWEHVAPGHRRYSFHIFLERQLITRWDNAPHRPDLSTFPHHRHTETGFEPAEDMNMAKVIEYLETLIQSP